MALGSLVILVHAFAGGYGPRGVMGMVGKAEVVLWEPARRRAYDVMARV